MSFNAGKVDTRTRTHTVPPCVVSASRANQMADRSNYHRPIIEKQCVTSKAMVTLSTLWTSAVCGNRSPRAVNRAHRTPIGVHRRRIADRALASAPAVPRGLIELVVAESNKNRSKKHRWRVARRCEGEGGERGDDLDDWTTTSSLPLIICNPLRNGSPFVRSGRSRVNSGWMFP